MQSAPSIREVASPRSFDAVRRYAVKKKAPFGACYDCFLRHRFFEPAVRQRRRESRLKHLAYRCGSRFQLTNAISDVPVHRQITVESALQSR
jgi:hypothetical protein